MDSEGESDALGLIDAETETLRDKLALDKLKMWLKGINTPWDNKHPLVRERRSKHMKGIKRMTKAYADDRQKPKKNRRPAGRTKRLRLRMKL
jgi:hypothetical protein